MKEVRPDLINGLLFGEETYYDHLKFDDVDSMDDVFNLMRYTAGCVESLLMWIVDTLGYPYDMYTDPPVPEWARPIIAELWYAKEEAEDCCTKEEHYQTIAEEGHWG
jgi:hypothetical protein